jgi:ANTAR domain
MIKEVLVPPHVVLDGFDDATGATAAPASRRSQDRGGERDRLERLALMDADDLRTLATTLPTIEQAKGIVMGCFGYDAAAAFAVLSRISSSENLKLRVLAASVVEAATSQAGSTSEPVPTPCEQVRRLFDPRHA